MPVLPMGAPVVYVGTAAPTAADDGATIGARVGYLWTWADSGTQRWYVCRSAASGAAVWDQSATLTGALASVQSYTTGVGVAPLDLPRVSELGECAFLDRYAAVGVYVTTSNAAYQVTPNDLRRVILTTSGTNTYTLPLASDVPDGWHFRVKNRSGNNLTVQRSGSDTIDGTTSITVSTGSGRFIARTGSTSFESM